MEKKKKDCPNRLLTTLMIVCVTLSVVILGIVSYDKFIKKEEKKVSNSVPVIVDNTSSTNFYQNLEKNRKTVTDYGKGITVILDKNGFVYYSSGKVENAVGISGEYQIEGYEAGIDPEKGEMSNTFNGYKLNISNVVMFYHAEVGNGGLHDYIFIKNDGSIAKLSYTAHEENGLTVVNIDGFQETVSGYKDIISVIQTNGFDAHDYKLVDINGNVY